MIPFLGINITTNKNNNQLNGNEFLVSTPSLALQNSLEKSAFQAENTIYNSKLPLPFRILKSICGITAFLILTGILKADVSFLQGYQNAPGLYYTMIVCSLLWLCLYIWSCKRSNKIIELEESKLTFSTFENISDNIYKDLNVPSTAKTADILSFYYKTKNSNIKVCEKGLQPFQFLNKEFKVFFDQENLYIADLDGKYAFPLSSFVKIHTIRKSIRLAGWYKDEDIKSDIYKPYKLSFNGYGCLICKSYHILEFQQNGIVWGIYIPSYELPVFEEILNSYLK